jgi:isocitrate dehydrogenase
MTAITVARGDGIGPEIMEATLAVLKATGAKLEFEEVEIGEKVYEAGHPTGIEPATWDSIRRTKVFLKAPITTPQGGGFKSLNVTVRTSLGLYANVRPCVAYAPYVDTKHPGMNVVIVRENEEDLYAGIEYRQTPDTYTSLKLISRPGSEKIIRYAFEYARANGRKKVSCFTKDNIMKLSDGTFHAVYEEIAGEYPDIENEHWIIDIGAAKLADGPQNFDVVVLPNLYGDILSDVGAQIAGSVGLVGSANIGEHGAMFEAIHGSAPRRAGQNLANPSGLMLGAVMMLVHIGETQAATAFHNAWLKTLEDGVHTYDIFKEGVSTQKVGTKEFGEAVVERLGQKPSKLTPVEYKAAPKQSHATFSATKAKKQLVGIDVFIEWHGSLDELRAKLPETALPLTMVANRGVRLWPEGQPETFCIDQWRCRFLAESASHDQLVTLLGQLANASIDFIKTDHLYTFDGKAAYST